MKKLDYKFEGTKMKVMVDPNEDGEALMTVEIDLAEVADEVIDALSKKK